MRGAKEISSIVLTSKHPDLLFKDYTLQQMTVKEKKEKKRALVGVLSG